MCSPGKVQGLLSCFLQPGRSRTNFLFACLMCQVGGRSSSSPLAHMADGVGVSISCSKELEQHRKLTLMVTMKENWQVDQPSYHSGPEQWLWVRSPQNPFHLWRARICNSARSVDPKLQDSHDTRELQDIQEESQLGPIINRVAEARDLKPDKWFIAKNTYK